MASAAVSSGKQRRKLTAFLTLAPLALTLVVGYGWYAGGNNAQHQAGRASRLVPSPVAIVPGIFLLGGLSPSAAYVIKTSGGLILVDSGLDADAGPLKAQMAKLGLDWHDIRAILLTHAHGDHTGGAQALRAATGARVYAGQGDVAVLRAGQPREAFFSTFSMPGHAPHPTKVDVVLMGDEIIRLGNARVRALGAPGHTPGSTLYLLEQDHLRVLFAGDVIMMLRGDDSPRTELGKALGIYSAYLSPRYRGNAQDFLLTLRRLRALPVPNLVLPGHPGADVAPQSPCLSRERWHSLLDQGILDMQTLLARYQADGALFLDGTPKPILRGLDYLGNFQGMAIYALFASAKLFVIGTPAGPGFVQFTSTRLRQLGRQPTIPTAILLTSCGRLETAGLKEVVEEWHPSVVATSTGLENLRESSPVGMLTLSSADLVRKGWFPVTPIPLQGRGVAPVAYQLQLSGKTVLFSGGVLSRINQETGEQLARDLASSTGDIRGYFGSLMQLHGLKADLWLPADPVDDQNANLYDGEWEHVIEDNLIAIKLILSNAQKR
jgi:glyoxylase-like metal-dependent hydrolase (beta-lactamase superfamily II)